MDRGTRPHEGKRGKNMKTDLRCIDGATVRQGEQVDLGQDDGEGDAEGPLDHGCRRAVDAGCIGIGPEKNLPDDCA